MTNGQFYLLEDAQRNYSEAVLKCKSIGYDGLAVIDSNVTFRSILQQLKYPKTEQYWIGMHYSVKKQLHVWDTGVDVTWADWNVGEPDNMPHDKCVRIRQTLNFGTWNCTATYMAVCGYYSQVYGDFQMEVRNQIHLSDPLWSGATRSMLDCVTHCMTDVKCQHVVYDNLRQNCMTLPQDYNATGGSQTVNAGVLISKEDSSFFTV
ncbi:hypothetical protein Btru_005853 [Bulinus truncatus]|nr:hypothetical protein Btru_005853 [Bulinus truncatus]